LQTVADATHCDQQRFAQPFAELRGFATEFTLAGTDRRKKAGSYRLSNIDYNIVMAMFGPLSTRRRITMKTTKAVLITAIGVGLTLGVGAQPGKHPGEKVDLKSLSTNVQQTINEKAAGRKVVKVAQRIIHNVLDNLDTKMTTL
jgi:hypothetical protein